MLRLFTGAALVGSLLVIGAPTRAAEFDDDHSPVNQHRSPDRDESWYYQPSTEPTSYQPNPLAIIHRKALERAAHRQLRLEGQYYSGVHRTRPTVNPLPWQYTYVYGSPLVSNGWGDTQLSIFGDGNSAMSQMLGRRPYASQNGRPTYIFR